MSMWELDVPSSPEVLKKRLRTRVAAIREMLGPEGRAKADAGIAQKVCVHPAYEDADLVFTYLSVGSEVDTRQIIRDAWSKGKTVAIPRVVKGTRKMEWYRIDDFDSIEKGAFGMEEPIADPERLVDVPGKGSDAKAVALVPGFSFDVQGYRIGYGGGFYDTFLPDFGGVSLGLCRIQQLSEDPIPCGEHDVPVDVVIKA